MNKKQIPRRNSVIRCSLALIEFRQTCRESQFAGRVGRKRGCRDGLHAEGRTIQADERHGREAVDA